MAQSRVQKGKGSKSKFPAWGVAILVIPVVAIAGYAIVRFSEAGRIAPKISSAYQQTITSRFLMSIYNAAGQKTTNSVQCYTISSSGDWCYYDKDSNISSQGWSATMFGRITDGRCATITRPGQSEVWNDKLTTSGYKNIPKGAQVNVYEYYVGEKSCPVKVRNNLGERTAN